ncbi:ATP-binding protein [Candidatus Saccharibacteria bacterium]|nr:ATP-binding protein [Candidatus Saccharibacteria bacterium]
MAVNNYRGVRDLNWHVPANNVCIVGPGDAGKSSVLDAIEVALSPDLSRAFDDADFYNLDTAKPIVVSVTIGGLDETDENVAVLLSAENYGMLLRGYKPGEVLDQPESDAEKVLTVELRVNDDLEAEWSIVAPGRESKRIRRQHLARFGVIKLGTFADWHFSWSQNSIIYRLLDGQTAGVQSVLAEIGREARRNTLALPILSVQATSLEADVRAFGVKAGTYSPKLDIQSMALKSGSLTLHDGNVPVRRHGTGSKRLIALALQNRLHAGKSVRLIDEIELGLEPHRIAQALSKMPVSEGHTIMTTHSPVVLRELEAKELVVFHNDDGVVKAVSFGSDLDADSLLAIQANLRKSAECFLAPRIIVCEGATEVGLVRAANEWRQALGKEAFSALGIMPMDAGGYANCAPIAERLRLAGYEVAVFCDSDTALTTPIADLNSNGINVFTWAGGVCTEQALFRDIPADLAAEVIRLAVANFTIESVRSKLTNVDAAYSTLPADPGHWPWGSAGFNANVASASVIGNDSSAWFKRTDRGQELGELVFPRIGELDASANFRMVIEALSHWCG